MLSSGLLNLIKLSIAIIIDKTVLKFVGLSGGPAPAKLKFLLGEKFVCIIFWCPEKGKSCRG
jgi:hypothetical protein